MAGRRRTKTPLRTTRATRAWLRDASMASKLSLLGGLVVALAAVLVSTALGVSQYLVAKREFDRGLQQQLLLTTDAVQAAVVFGDLETLREQLEPLIANTQIYAIRVFKGSAEVFSFERRKRGTASEALAVTDQFEQVAALFASSHTVEGAVYANGVPVGRVEIAASFAAQTRTLLLNYVALVVVMLLAIGLSAWLMRKLALIVTRPLVHLKEVMIEVQTTRDYELRADIETDDEVGALAKVFNGMLERVEATDTTLRRELETRKTAESRFQHLAMHDALTGLPNRASFMTQLEAALVEHSFSGKACALLFVDLDNFKYVNDTYGHAVGDSALRQVAHRLDQAVRGSDVIARLGGDEFAILLIGMADATAAVETGNKIAQSVRHAMRLGDITAYVGCSIGVRMFDNELGDAALLLSQADAAMYSAKALGKDRAALFEPKMAATARGHASVAQLLRMALDEKRLTVHYQPQYTVDGLKLVGFEALARWPGGPGPAEFIPVAEESGLILPVSDYIIDRVLDQVQLWAQEGQPRVPVAINVAAKQLYLEGFSTNLLARIAAKNIDPRWVEIELTESTFLYDLDVAVETLTELGKQGITIAIDDFGTGYSALNYLKALPVNSVKLDRSFIRGLTADSRDRKVVQAVIDIARALSFDVVAEGVETEHELDVLAQMGCSRVQGYLLGKPVAPEDAWHQHEQLQLRMQQHTRVKKAPTHVE
jgi:diguanylate cyclase